MNTQYLQYVREQLMAATADLNGATKGQLEAGRSMHNLILVHTNERSRAFWMW